KVKSAYLDSSSQPLFRENLSRIFSSFSSAGFLEKMGSLLDGGLRLDSQTFEKMAILLDKKAVPVLIGLLGYLDTISARRTVVNLLSKVGRSDVAAVTAGLDDYRWYVVRNTVIALRNIGDKTARDHLIKIFGHGDARVRREVVKALARTGGAESFGVFSKALDDKDQSVRQAALSALSELGLPQAKELLLDRVKSNAFLSRDYEEKKDYVLALLGFRGEDVRMFIGKMLERKRFFRQAKNDECKLAMAYGIGIKGDREYLPYLYKLGDNRNEMLQLAAAEAIRKIEHGH
ncbi:MAG TPA: HEAT repeat domain-containing protein, partial [Dissulfurispiraceae bacterium]|nr:HEAT repeat domain-containing protein [Dissulfurispiraceae bacterium]